MLEACGTVSPLRVDGLPRFIQVLLQVGHKGGAAGPDSRGIADIRLMLTMDVAVGITDMDLAELGE